jgi:hypothetical protein
MMKAAARPVLSRQTQSNLKISQQGNGTAAAFSSCISAKIARIWILGESCHVIDHIGVLWDPFLDTFNDAFGLSADQLTAETIIALSNERFWIQASDLKHEIACSVLHVVSSDFVFCLSRNSGTMRDSRVSGGRLHCTRGAF